jgi:hypothetical protein
LKNSEFNKNIEVLFNGDPSGYLEFPDFQDLLEKLSELKTEVKSLKNQSKK